jgi:uncharacterized membrane protein (UPF0136 family)
MTLGIIAAIAYGLLSIIGGVMGYTQAKSKASLISGGISGALLLFAAILQLAGSPIGLTLAAIVSAALVVVFAIRLTKTRKFMPAGLMLIAGLATLGAILPSLFI